MPRADVAVIGAGLAGLACAAELAQRGASVFLCAKGMATTHWTHGGLDLGFVDGAATATQAVRALGADASHPYALLGEDVAPAVAAHFARLKSTRVLYTGDLDAPMASIPTAIGALRPAAVLPAAQAAAIEPWGDDGLLLIGFARYRDAWASYAARNLATAAWPDGPREVRAVEVELPALADVHNLNARSLALAFDDPRWRTDALRAIAAAIPAGAWRIGLPAVLGLEAHATVLAEAQERLGHRLFEIPSLPPSVPGLRLWNALRRVIADAGGRMQVGFDVVDVERDGDRIVAIHTEAASRTLRIAAGEFVLATGGIAGGGLRAHPDGSLEERVFGLPVTAPEPEAWLTDDAFARQPLEAAGIRPDVSLRAGLLNVRVIGSALAGMHYLSQRCGDGVALASAHRAARLVAGAGV